MIFCKCKRMFTDTATHVQSTRKGLNGHIMNIDPGHNCYTYKMALNVFDLKSPKRNGLYRINSPSCKQFTSNCIY